MTSDQPAVLVVDDHPANRRILARALSGLDLVILEAGSGPEALSYVQENHSLCVALLDVRMPDMDGYTVATKLRENPKTVSLPIIFISAIETDAYHHRKAYETGAVDFLNKPVSPRILRSKVRVFVELYQQRRRLEAANKALSRQTIRLETTSDVSQHITSILDLDELLMQILQLLHTRFGYDYLGIWMVNGKAPDGTMSLRAGQYGTPGPQSNPGYTIPLQASRSIVAHVGRTGDTYLCNDTTRDQRYLAAPGLEAIRSECALPLRFGDTLMGVLDLQSESPEAFQPGDVTAMKTLADQIAVAIRNVRLYAEVTRLNEQLEGEVAARTEELQKAYHQLEILDQNKSDFITVVSHELRTPLTLINGFSQMLAQDPVVLEDPARQQQVNGIVNGAHRMHAIVDSMLDVVKIDSRTLRLNRRSVVVADLIAALSRRLGSALRSRRQVLTVNQIAQLPPIEADPEALTKVFDELLSNAIKYTPDGGRITISGHILEDASESDAGYLEIVVSDTGIGIEPDHQELIFAKFFRTGEVTLHSSGRTKFKAGGPGLGLAIARGIVEAHGGHIWADSPGHDETRMPGSHFHVVLPMSQPFL